MPQRDGFHSGRPEGGWELDKTEKAEKGSREGGRRCDGSAVRNPPPPAVGTVGIAVPAAVCREERWRNDPPPQGRCPSGGGKSGLTRRVIQGGAAAGAFHRRGSIHRPNRNLVRT